MIDIREWARRVISDALWSYDETRPRMCADKAVEALFPVLDACTDVVRRAVVLLKANKQAIDDSEASMSHDVTLGFRELEVAVERLGQTTIASHVVELRSRLQQVLTDALLDDLEAFVVMEMARARREETAALMRAVKERDAYANAARAFLDATDPDDEHERSGPSKALADAVERIDATLQAPTPSPLNETYTEKITRIVGVLKARLSVEEYATLENILGDYTTDEWFCKKLREERGG
jgi:hypothetical protein